VNELAPPVFPRAPQKTVEVIHHRLIESVALVGLATRMSAVSGATSREVVALESRLVSVYEATVPTGEARAVAPTHQGMCNFNWNFRGQEIERSALVAGDGGCLVDATEFFGDAEYRLDVQPEGESRRKP
jgi:hypothetical protein